MSEVLMTESAQNIINRRKKGEWRQRREGQEWQATIAYSRDTAVLVFFHSLILN